MRSRAASLVVLALALTGAAALAMLAAAALTGETREPPRQDPLARAIRIFEASHAGPPGERARAEAAARGLVESRAGAGPRSAAANLLGILAFEEAALERTRARRHLRQSVASFTEAARLDPGNEDAKYNLELVLALAASEGEGAETGDGAGSGQVRPGGGASSTPPGQGY